MVTLAKKDDDWKIHFSVPSTSTREIQISFERIQFGEKKQREREKKETPEEMNRS
jgi:hypothetical protein